MEWGLYFRFAATLVFVLGLIGLMALLLRRFGLTARVTPSAKKGRLAVVEVRPIDAKRRLVLLRRDSVEHLVLLGIGQALVIEQSIPLPADRPADTRREDAP